MALKKEDVTKNINEAITELKAYLENCIETDSKGIKKANLLSYWLKDYTKYIENEKDFDSSKLKKYEYGDVIKVNLGFNIGNEEGGLHYCIVLDKYNSPKYSTLTVVPLTSVKPHSKIHNTSVLLGNDIYFSIIEKARSLLNSIDRENTISFQNKAIKILRNEFSEEKNKKETLPIITAEEFNAIKDFKEKHSLILKIIDEVEQMKKGSIALVNQITTISKQRIYDPKNDFDILAGIKVSNEKMNLISTKIKKLFMNFE